MYSNKLETLHLDSETVLELDSRFDANSRFDASLEPGSISEQNIKQASAQPSQAKRPFALLRAVLFGASALVAIVVCFIFDPQAFNTDTDIE